MGSIAATRHDTAMSLAISAHETTIAIGTTRGRILVVALSALANPACSAYRMGSLAGSERRVGFDLHDEHL